MPTYEFRCPDGHEFEKFYRSISGAESQATCPVCGKLAERMMSAAGFAFKGSGFYLTDYGKNAHRDKGTPEPKSGESSGGESSGDSSKPESAAGEAKSGSATDSAKGSDAPSAGSESTKQKRAEKAEAKTAEPKPASPPPKPGKNE
jgi:putative FmdB family regulatory protein